MQLEVVRLIGELVSLSKFRLGKDYPALFVEFLEKFSDDSIQVRIAAVECVKSCIISDPSGDEESVILSKFITCDCLLLIFNFASFYYLYSVLGQYLSVETLQNCIKKQAPRVLI